MEINLLHTLIRNNIIELYIYDSLVKTLIFDFMVQYKFEIISIVLVHICHTNVDYHNVNTKFQVSSLSLLCLVIYLKLSDIQLQSNNKLKHCATVSPWHCKFQY